MSRPRPSDVGQFGVATWSFEVVTWGRLPGRVATSEHPASVRPVYYALSSAHDMGTASARDLVSGLGSLFGYCSWILFMSTIHREKKEYKIFKNLLVYDLKYNIFILKLL